MTQKNNKAITPLLIKELLNQDHYIVPIYQRNYAWGNDEIELLITDIQKAQERSKNDSNYRYYIGSLVVFKRADGKFEVIDGQQRLTTLAILLAYLRSEEAVNVDLPTGGNLSYEYRQESDLALQQLFAPKADLPSNFQQAKQSIEKHWAAVQHPQELSHFLFNQVEIIRTEVPPETDLNHYFEIMNTRGEQLEKHEILKARLMNKLDKEDQPTFATIWDACSDMNRYMVLCFPAKSRKLIFSTNYSKIPSDFEHIKNELVKAKDEQYEQNEDKAKSILEIISNHQMANHETDKETSERFNSVIDFPNFLLHVLRIFTENYLYQDFSNIQLDEKVLLDSFADLEKVENKQEIKIFIMYLFKCRYLFDRYIIKSDTNKEQDDHWSLLTAVPSNSSSYTYNNSFSNEEEQQQIMILLSMFHVSYPSRIYKNWLYAVLRWLYGNQEQINGTTYADYLEKLSDRFYFGNYINKIDFLKLIEDPQESDCAIENKEAIKAVLNNGTGVPNFIFNRLDYLIWKNNKTQYKDFRFTFRSSVEHFYPQHPPENQEPLDPDVLHSFGNLCLLSSSHNSRFTNNMPEAKKANFRNLKHHSLKLALMMNAITENEKWDEKAIEKHGEAMIKLLNNQTDYSTA